MAIQYNPQVKAEFIGAVVGELGKMSVLLQDDVLTKLNQYLLEFDTKGGRFVDESRALQIIADLEREVEKIIDASPYKASVLKWSRNFEQINKFNIEAQKSVNGIRVPRSLFTSAQKFQIDKTVKDLVGGGVSNAFTKPMTEALMRNIVLGSTVSDTKNFLQQYIIGQGDKLGKLERYSTQVGRDLLNTYDGQVNAQIQLEYDMNAYMYVGSLVEDSRPQCVRWIEEFDGELLVDDLADEIQWAKDNGSGMREETNTENFAVYRGGWNCRHEAIPFRKK